MFDLLIVNPSSKVETYGSLSELSAIEPPLHCALLAAYVREKGHSVAILDAEAEGLGVEQTAQTIADYNPLVTAIIVLGINPTASSTPKMTMVGQLLTRLLEIRPHNPNMPILLWGLHPSALPRETLYGVATDFVIQGEGFEAMAMLVEMVKNPYRYSTCEIPGLWARGGPEPQLANLVDINELPMTAWDLLPMDKYRAHNWHCLHDLEHRSPYAMVFTSLGCPFSCSYCLPSDTPILMADLTWKPIQNVTKGNVVIGVDASSRFVETKVIEIVKQEAQPLLKIETELGNVRCTFEHSWLTIHNRWRQANKLKVGQYLRNVSAMPLLSREVTSEYRIGYLAGAAVGDGTFQKQRNKRGLKSSHHFRLIGDSEMMNTFMEYALQQGLDAHWGKFKNGLNSPYKYPFKAIYITKNSETDKLCSWTDNHNTSSEYRRGFLAGFYDAEGSYSCNILRIANYDKELLKKVEGYLYGFGFVTRQEPRGLRLIGGRKEHIRLFSLIQPKVIHKRKLKGRLRQRTRITNISPCGFADVFNLETETHNYIASGFVSHNCNIHALYNSKPGIRFRSPEKVIEEIDFLVKNYGIKNIKVMDELFTLTQKHVDGICNLLIERNYGLNIWAYARIGLVNPVTLRQMKKAGISWVAYGLESASEIIRQGVSKKFSYEEMLSTILMTRAAGINIIANFVFGLPDDSLETMQQTLDMAKQFNFEWVNFYICMPYPGSKLYEEAVRQRAELPEEWADWGQYSSGLMPLPTKYLSGNEIVEFRDKAFIEYFNRPNYLKMIENKFGLKARKHIEEMLRQKVKRS